LFKIARDFVLVVAFFCVLDTILYFKDYNEVIVVSEYIKHEISMNNIKSFKTEKYEVLINEKKYKIIYHRDSLFAFRNDKFIKYDGIVD